jgi:putative addiction module component (TIGR02574 family)
MAVLSKSEIAALSLSERVALIEALWKSFEGTRATTDTAAPEQWEQEILDDRLTDLEIHPHDQIIAQQRAE